MTLSVSTSVPNEPDPLHDPVVLNTTAPPADPSFVDSCNPATIGKVRALYP